MRSADERLLRIAAEVSDGAAVDWARLETGVEDRDERELIRNLRVLSRAAGVFRDSDADPSDVTSGAVTTATTDDAASPAPENATQTGWKHLQLRGELGRGGFGVVHRAWDPLLEREVALKLLAASGPEAGSASGGPSSRFLREGRLLARVRHPNVVTVHGVDIEGETVGLWMELIRGRTLAAWVREQGRLGAREAAVIGAGLCRALGAVHGAGIVHGDVKAQNVMREEGGRIVLMDFGTGAELRAEAAQSRVLSGTPFYMAPEVLFGEPATSRSDLYSLGVVLYYLVTGEHPVTGRTLAEITEAHRSGAVKLLRDARPDLPDSLVRVVERALSRAPAARFASAGEMEVALLAAIGADERIGGHAESRIPDNAAKRRGVLVGSAAGLVLISLGFVLWQITAHRQPVHGPYTVDAAMFRSQGEVRERLDPGGFVAPGDRVSLEFQGSRDLYVYVLNEDDLGNSYVLFPLAGVEPGNPLPGSTRHRLPGVDQNGEPLSWKVTTVGGKERFLLVASPEPLKELESDIEALPRPKQGESVQYARLSQTATRHLRGVGGLERDPPSSAASASGQLFERVARLARQAEEIRGVWIRQIDVENPG